MLEPLWSFAAHQQVHAFAGDQHEVFVACRSSRLYSLDARTGQTRWSAGVLNAWGWLALSSARVFYLNQHSRLDAYDRQTGALCWSRELGGYNGWLHAWGRTAVVGGWRAYSDVVGLDEADGSTRWTYPARGMGLHSTRVHAESSTLLVATREDRGWFVFVDLASGKVVHKVGVPGAWTETFAEHPAGSSNDEPLVVDGGPTSLVVVTGVVPTVTHVELPEASWSQNLRHVDGFVPYITTGGELVAWSLAGCDLRRLGFVRHNRRDLLPFAAFDADLFAYGTSFGLLGLTSTIAERRSASRIGKSVTTHLAHSATAIVFGSGGGQVLAYSRMANVTSRGN